MDTTELRQRLKDYTFYHRIQLTDDIITGTPGNGEASEEMLKALDSVDLKGKRVLDVGCRDGLYSFIAERSGAAEVIAIDNDLSRGAVDVLIPYLGSGVRMHEMNLYELTAAHFGVFDVLIFSNLLYHLRYPFWAFKVLKDVIKPGGKLIVGTAIYCGAENHAMLYCPIGLEGPNGDPTSCTFFNRKGLVDTLTSLGWRTLSAAVRTPPIAPEKTRRRSSRAVSSSSSTGHAANATVDRTAHKHDVNSRIGGEAPGRPF